MIIWNDSLSISTEISQTFVWNALDTNKQVDTNIQTNKCLKKCDAHKKAKMSGILILSPNHKTGTFLFPFNFFPIEKSDGISGNVWSKYQHWRSAQIMAELPQI